MISFPSRCGALALVLAAGSLTASNAQTPATDTMAHTDAQGRHFAPHDTFYMLEYVSARTDKGVEGFEPGTEVHLVTVNQEARTLTVSDGHAQVDVPPEKLTNDMDIAALVRAKDQANQARIAAYQQAEAKAYQEYEKAAAEYTAKDLEKRKQDEQAAEDRAREQVASNQSAQPVNASVNTNNNSGYYDNGGYGYGTPYWYFVNNLHRSNVTGGNRGTVSSSQNTSVPGGTRTGGAAPSSGSAPAGGGKKP